MYHNLESTEHSSHHILSLSENPSALLPFRTPSLLVPFRGAVSGVQSQRTDARPLRDPLQGLELGIEID